jgi:hypothetical protein
VAGTVVRARTATLWPGNDGIGSLQVALLESCEADAPFVVGTGVMDADFSEFGNTVDYLIEGVASGTYGIVGYMDDNGDLDPKAPGPNQGDLVFAEGAGPGCLEVEVLDADLEGADFPLTLALPF